MVGPPSVRELCLETMKIQVKRLMVGEPCKTVSIGFLNSRFGLSAWERFGARTAFGSPGPGVRMQLGRRGMEGATWECKAEAVLCG